MAAVAVWLVPALIGAGTTAATAVIGSRASGRATDAWAAGNTRSAELSYRANQEALEFQREVEETRKAEFAETEAERRRQWDYQRKQWEAREGRLSPYRELGGAAVGSLAQGLGLGGDIGARAAGIDYGRVSFDEMLAEQGDLAAGISAGGLPPEAPRGDETGTMAMMLAGMKRSAEAPRLEAPTVSESMARIMPQRRAAGPPTRQPGGVALSPPSMASIVSPSVVYMQEGGRARAVPRRLVTNRWV